MKVHTVAISRPWDDKETVSIHMTRKGALQVACADGLEMLMECYEGMDDEDLTWTEDSLYTVDNPNHSLTIKELDAMFNYMEQLLWNLEIGIEVLEYTLQP